MIKKVRNYFVLCTVALLSVFVFAACGDDDEDEPNGNKKSGIVGEWLVTHDKGWEKENGEIVDEWDEDIDYDSYIFDFKNDGNVYIWESGKLDMRAKYKYSGSKLTLTYTEDGLIMTDNCTCKISGDNMTMTFSEKEIEDGVTYEYYDEMKLVRM